MGLLPRGRKDEGGIKQRGSVGWSKSSVDDRRKSTKRASRHLNRQEVTLESCQSNFAGTLGEVQQNFESRIHMGSYCPRCRGAGGYQPERLEAPNARPASHWKLWERQK